MKVAPAFFQTLLSQVLQSSASIAVGILIARGLGPEGQGQYALVVAAVGLLSTVGAGGQYEAHVLGSAGDTSRGRVLLARSGLQAALVGLAAVLSFPLWGRGLAALDAQLLPLLLVALLTGEVAALLLRGINLGQHHILAYNVAMLLQRFGFLAIVAVLMATRGLRVGAVLAAWLGAVALNVAFSGLWIWRRSAAVSLTRQGLVRGWVSALRQGTRALLTISLTLLLLRADVYMLGPMIGLPAVGQMSVAMLLAEYCWYIPSILASVLFAAAAANRGPGTIDQICRASRTAVAVLAPLTIALAVVGARLVPLIYGGQFAPAGSAFVLLLPGTLAIALHLIVDSYFAGSGFPPISYLAAAGALVVKVALNLALVPRIGIDGAAVATSLAYMALFVAKVWRLRRETGVTIPALLRPRTGDLVHAWAALRSWLGAPQRV